MKELQPLFLKNFSKNRITYGPAVGTAVKFRVVADKDFKAEIVKEAQRLANSTIHLHLKFAPEQVLKNLERYYKVMKQPFPTRLKVIDENTQLTREEKVSLFTLTQVLTVSKATAEADKTGGFYSPLANEIVFRESQIDAGTVAHEMAHAYANQGWHDFIHVLKLRGIPDMDKLDEGMTTHVERIVVKDWWAKQPSGTTIPIAAYDATYTKRAGEFVKALGQDLAYEAYFGGWVDYASNAKPEDTLIIGNKTKKKNWQWPWKVPMPVPAPAPVRAPGSTVAPTVRHFQWVFR
ncbi:MAG: hypothetical protein ABI831_12380 [Betaproteobacteria bacterium]